MSNLPSVKSDARDRALRTLAQGALVDVLVACAAVLLLWLPDADLTAREAWLALAVSAGKSALTAVASYVMRLKVSPVAPKPTGGPLCGACYTEYGTEVAMVADEENGGYLCPVHDAASVYGDRG